MKTWFTRFPQQHIDRTYLKNISEATLFFMEWFRNSTISYHEMLIKMHQITSNGYAGHTNSKRKMNKIQSLFRNHPKIGEIEHPNLKKEWYNLEDKPIMQPRVKGVPINMSHQIVTTEQGYRLHLPHSKHLSYYLNKLEKAMDDIKRSNVKSLVVHYMNLFVIAHPFEKINFSICMAQVNAILHMRGYRTVHHEYMDFDCFLYDSNIIENNFIKKII